MPCRDGEVHREGFDDDRHRDPRRDGSRPRASIRELLCVVHLSGASIDSTSNLLEVAITWQDLPPHEAHLEIAALDILTVRRGLSLDHRHKVRTDLEACG